jgi:hypothetical protein
MYPLPKAIVDASAWSVGDTQGKLSIEVTGVMLRLKLVRLEVDERDAHVWHAPGAMFAAIQYQTQVKRR